MTPASIEAGAFHTSEAELIDAMLHLGWYDEVLAGQRTLAEAEAAAWIDRAIADGLPVRGADRDDRRFDARLAFNFMRDRGLSGRDPLWLERIVASKRRRAEAYASATPPEGTAEAPRRVSLLMQREVVRADLVPGRATILALPVPQEEATQRDLVVDPIAEPGATLTHEPGAVLRRGRVPPDGIVRVAARVTFTSTWRTHALDRVPVEPIDLADPQLRPYLSAQDGLVRVTPEIAKLAARLRTPDPVATLRAFWDFLFDHLTYGVVHYDELSTGDPLSDAIRGRWVDCYVASSLLVALCRAVGLPARLVHGLMLWPSDLGPHYWLEVLLPPHGWVPFDAFASVLAGGDKTQGLWAASSFGRLPHQLVLFRPPAQGQLGLRLPPTWFSVQRFAGKATCAQFYDRATGALFCRDQCERVE